MKTFFVLVSLLLATGVLAECRELPLNYIINESITLCSDTYDAPDGITIAANNVVLDCGTAVIRGNRAGRGIIAENRQSITIQNCNIVTFATGIFFKNVSRAIVTGNNLLKNELGILLEDSHENWIAANTDKSLQMPIAVIKGKYNTISFENRNIEGSICVHNVCNAQETLNPCVSFDNYCSSVCSEQSDEDCKPKPPEVSAQATQEVKNYYEDTEKRYSAAAAGVKKLEEEIRQQISPSTATPAKIINASIMPMLIVSAVIVGIAVIVLMRNKTE